MSTIYVEKGIFKELIQFKLKRINTFIEEILERWKEISADVFIEKARYGIYEDAENDAIELQQLLLEEKKLRDLLVQADADR